jgi:hypothetical protein
MLTKDEFKNEIVNNIDEMYNAYKKAEEKASNPADDLLSKRKNLPEFKASDIILSTTEKEKMIEKLEKSDETEKIILTVGKVILAIGILAATTT